MTITITRRHIASLCLLFVALVLFTAQTKPAASLYTDTNYKFSMSPPNLGTSKTSATPVVFSGPAANGFAPNVNIIVQFVKTNRAAYLADAVGSMPSMGGKLVGTKELQVSGKDAAVIEYRATLAGKDLHFLAMFVVADDRVYLITCTALDESFKEAQPAFQAALDSFKVTG
jgi:hypothetical protein